MILHSDSLISLDYDPASDILTVQWPNLQDTPASEIEYSFTNLVTAIRRYDIKNLLIDLSTTKGFLPIDQHKEVVKHFLSSLTSTRLQKLARIMSQDLTREPLIRIFFEQQKADQNLPYEITFFTDKQSAFEWLKGNR